MKPEVIRALDRAIVGVLHQSECGMTLHTLRIALSMGTGPRSEFAWRRAFDPRTRLIIRARALRLASLGRIAIRRMNGAEVFGSVFEQSLFQRRSA
jgi:hypothetical protein